MLVPNSQIFMTQYSIFEHPLDFPRHYVVRAAYILRNRPDPNDIDSAIRLAFTACVCDTLEEARACVPVGLYNLGRSYEDETRPTLLEVWI